MVKVRVKMLSFWNIDTSWVLVMISSQDVVDVVDSSWPHSDFGEVSWPNSTVGVLGLILGEVGGIDSVMNVSVSVVPLLVVVLLEVVVGWVD